ncbi:TetR/AcrR family transcriptional regulator [Thermaurantiacus sp.]
MATRADERRRNPTRAPRSVVRGAGRQAARADDGRARRYDPAETRTRVLEAAYMLFSTRGYAGTGTADIAREADVSEGSIFYHFGSKRALLSELGRLHGEKMIAAMQGDDALADVTFEVSINRCFDFCEINTVWDEIVHDGSECPGPGPRGHTHNPEAEPFFHAAREVVMEWTRQHLEARMQRDGRSGVEVDLAASFIFALVGDSMQHYFRPGVSDGEKQRIRREVVRFCSAAVQEPTR